MLAIINYISELKIHLYTENSKFNCLEINGLPEKLNGISRAIIIVQYNYKQEKIKKFIADLLDRSEIEEYLLTTSTILLQYTFQIKNVFYINVNFVHFDEFETVYLGSMINGERHPIEVDSLKKQVITNDCYVECYLEYLIDKTQKSLKIDGKVEDCIRQIHTETNSFDNISKLLNAIYVDSLSIQLKTLFQNKLLMQFCQNMPAMNDNIGMIRFLQTPSFLKEVRFVWKSIETDGVLVGAIRLNKIMNDEKMQFNKKEDFKFADQLEFFDKMLDL